MMGYCWSKMRYISQIGSKQSDLNVGYEDYWVFGMHTYLPEELKIDLSWLALMVCCGYEAIWCMIYCWSKMKYLSDGNKITKSVYEF